LAFIELENFGIVSEVKDEKLSVRQVYRHFVGCTWYRYPFFRNLCDVLDPDPTPAGTVDSDSES
jgi:hypothetical protein